MYCKNCGKEVEDGQELCVNCKPAEVVVEEVKAEEQTQQQGPVQENVGQNFDRGNVVQDSSSNVGEKSRVASGLLAIFLGYLGIHNFYLGYTGKAVAQLLITVLSCFMLSPISAIWALIEGVMIFTDKSYVDAEGNLLKD